MIRPVPTYRLHDTTGDDLGLLEHPAPNLEPSDVVVLAGFRLQPGQRTEHAMARPSLE
jgi:hypothetical protein